MTPKQHIRKIYPMSHCFIRYDGTYGVFVGDGRIFILGNGGTSVLAWDDALYNIQQDVLRKLEQ